MQTEWLERIVAFLTEIGIGVRHGEVRGGFLPGVTVERGDVVFDLDRLAHVGDLVHEAGHVAVTAPEQRSQSTLIDPDPGLEMAAIAWSWAALRAMNLPPEVVFHERGYKGGSRAIIEAFETGPAFGVPILEWLGMTKTQRHAVAAGVPPFPHMLRWLR